MSRGLWALPGHPANCLPNSPALDFSTRQLCLGTPWWSLGAAQTLMSSAAMCCSTRSTAMPGSCPNSHVSPLTTLPGRPCPGGRPLAGSQSGPFRLSGKAPIPCVSFAHPRGCPPFFFILRKVYFFIKSFVKNFLKI